MSFECFARFVLYYYDDYSKRKLCGNKKKKEIRVVKTGKNEASVR